MKRLSLQDVHDILYGCVILGTGGGGDLSVGMNLIEDAAAQGKEFLLADINEVPDDELIVTPYVLGAISDLPAEELKQYQDLPQNPDNPIITAANHLEENFGRPIYGTIACETGGINTAIPMFLAACKGGIILDADTAGRAVPEVQNSTYYIHKLPVSPIFVSNEFGEVAVYHKVKDDLRAETILRSFSTVSKKFVSAIDHALPMKDLRNAIIPGTISKALKLGQAYRKAKEENKNVSRAIADAADGRVVFTGKVRNFEWKTEGGFTLGSAEANGTNTCSGEQLKVWFKNENLVTWLNGEIHVTLPDLICIIDTDLGEPVTNPNFRNDMNITVIIYPAPEAFTTPEGLKAFGPRQFGFEIDYRPAIGRIEDIANIP